jgi:hypothetical protein
MFIYLLHTELLGLTHVALAARNEFLFTVGMLSASARS